MRQSIFITFIGIPLLALSNELSLSLENAIKIAINNSLDLSMVKNKIIAAEERENQARKEFLPKLNLEIGTGKKRINAQDEFVDFLGEKIKISQPSSSSWKNNILFNVKQKLYSGKELSSKVGLAKCQKEYLRYENEIIKQNLVFSVIEAYWKLKYSQYYLDFAKKKVDMVKALLEIAKKEKEMGKIEESKLRKEELKKDYAEYELAIAKNERDIALNALVSFLNIKEEFNLIDEPKIESLNITEGEFVVRALENNFKIKQLEKRIEEGKWYVVLLKSSKYPQVNMEYFLTYSGNKDKYRDSLDDLKFSDWEIRLNITMLIYDGRFIQSKIREAEADLRIIKDEYLKVKNEVISKAKEMFLGLKRKENQYKIQENALFLAKENLKNLEAHYTLGNITEKEVIQSQIILNEAMIKLIEIKIDYEIAKGKLLNLISFNQNK